MSNMTVVSNFIRTDLKNIGENGVKFSIPEKTWKKDDNGENVTVWYNCTAWGKTADNIKNHLGKGSFVTVYGNVSEFETDEGNVLWSLDVSRVDFGPKFEAKKDDETPF